MTTFDIELEYETERPHTLRVVGAYSLGRPAPKVRWSNFDATFCDAGDPGEIDIRKVYLVRKGSERSLSGWKVPEHLYRMAWDKVAEGL